METRLVSRVDVRGTERDRRKWMRRETNKKCKAQRKQLYFELVNSVTPYGWTNEWSFSFVFLCVVPFYFPTLHRSQSDSPFIHLSFKWPFAVRCANKSRMRIHTKSKIPTTKNVSVNRFGQCSCGSGLQSNIVLTLTDINHNVSQPNEMQTTNRNLAEYCTEESFAEKFKTQWQLALRTWVVRRERSGHQGIWESSSNRTITTHAGNKTKSWVER